MVQGYNKTSNCLLTLHLGARFLLELARLVIRFSSIPTQSDTKLDVAFAELIGKVEMGSTSGSR